MIINWNELSNKFRTRWAWTRKQVLHIYKCRNDACIPSVSVFLLLWHRCNPTSTTCITSVCPWHLEAVGAHCFLFCSVAFAASCWWRFVKWFEFLHAFQNKSVVVRLYCEKTHTYCLDERLSAPQNAKTSLRPIIVEQFNKGWWSTCVQFSSETNNHSHLTYESPSLWTVGENIQTTDTESLF